MRASEIREMEFEEVTEQLEEAREAYFKMRFQFATGQLPDTSKLRAARRDVARVATVLREMKAAGRTTGTSEAPGRRLLRARRGPKSEESDE